jgi:hypothetical protein
MKRFVSLLIFSLFWLVPSCGSHASMVNYVKAKYPNCDVLKADQQGDIVKIIIQCPGNRIKTVTMHDKS